MNKVDSEVRNIMHEISVSEESNSYIYHFNPPIEELDASELSEIIANELPFGSPTTRVQGLEFSRQQSSDGQTELAGPNRLRILKSTSLSTVENFFAAANRTGHFNFKITNEKYSS